MTEQAAELEQEELAPLETEGEAEKQAEQPKDPWADFTPPEGFEEKYVDIDRFNKVYGKMKHYERQIQAKPQPEKETPQQTTGRPQLDDFDSQEEYEEAVVDWKLEQREQKKQKETWQQTQQQRNQQFDQKMARGHSKYPDFEQVYEPDAMPFSQMMEEVSKDFDHPEDLTYFLYKNKDIAQRIAGIRNPIQIAREFTKIEAELAKVPPRTKTAAPDPAGPIGDSEKLPKKLEDMSYEEYREYMNRKQFGKR